MEFIQNIYNAEDLKPRNRLIRKSFLTGEEPLFGTPFDVLANENGSLIVSDSRHGTLWLMGATGGAKALPDGDPRIDFPLGLAKDKSGNIYVAEGRRGRIAVLNPEGQVERYIGENSFKGNPSFLALDDTRKLLYASVASKHQIEVFSLDGLHLRTIGSPGIEPGQLAGPQGVAVNANGELLVAEMLSSRLSVFDTEGSFLRTIPFGGWGAYAYNAPKGLAIGKDGKIWVTDQRIGALVVFNKDEAPEMVIGAGQMSTHPLAFAAPSGLDITAGGSLWVVDLLLRRVNHWQELTPVYLQGHPIDLKVQQKHPAWVN